MIICVTGTPGTGKSTISHRLAKDLKGVLVDGNMIIDKFALAEGNDEIRDCILIDRKKFVDACLKECRVKKKIYIVDSHLSHHLPPRSVNLCIICKADLKVLNNRLSKRRYIASKIRENLDAEIFDICYEEARARGHKLLIYTKEVGITTLKSQIESILDRKGV